MSFAYDPDEQAGAVSCIIQKIVCAALVDLFVLLHVPSARFLGNRIADRLPAIYRSRREGARTSRGQVRKYSTGRLARRSVRFRTDM